MGQETLLEFGEKSKGKENAVKLITTIMECVTLDSKQEQCWPLKDYPSIAVWPMDVESMVDASLAGMGQTVGHSIFRAALNIDFWKESCELGAMCPFCENRRLLEEPNALDNLINFLFYFLV